MTINCLHPEAQLLGYKCHLRYIFIYTLQNQLILINNLRIGRITFIYI